MQDEETEEHVLLLDVNVSGWEEEFCSVFSDSEQDRREEVILGSEVKQVWATGSGTRWTTGNMVALLDGDRGGEGGGDGVEGKEEVHDSTYRGKETWILQTKENINNLLM